MSLSSVLGHVGVDEVHNVLTDGGGEHGGHSEGAGGLVLVLVDGDDGSG
eukprot:CAMPEP_0114676722 /NCGR_PEP_ID=MMETSP0191-20121206/49612_1 /TAXON_ID=126664 /ORGANISM="Sorites sp." /LENGTH=48 /DNA_ID= /DNA_START= /DNA_END= /DNA_ORIENTATION=